jgi:hypothetical protein
MLGRFFRTRSADRDRAADEARWTSVTSSITEALEGARRERDGLQRRYGQVQSNAAFLYDGDTGESGGPEALGRMEDELLAAERRLAALSRQIELLQELSGTANRLRAAALGGDKR